MFWNAFSHLELTSCQMGTDVLFPTPAHPISLEVMLALVGNFYDKLLEGVIILGSKYLLKHTLPHYLEKTGGRLHLTQSFNVLCVVLSWLVSLVINLYMFE